MRLQIFVKGLNYLCVKTRTFSPVKSKMGTPWLFLWKNKTRSPKTSIKKVMRYPESSWNLLILIQKHSYFDSYIRGNSYWIAINMEKTYFAVLYVNRIWNSRPILCRWLYRTTIFCLLQNNYFEKHISQKIKLKYICLKCLLPFYWFHLSLSVSHNYRKRKNSVTLKKT